MVVLATRTMPTRDEMAHEIGAALLQLVTQRQTISSSRLRMFTDADSNWGAGGKFGPYASLQGLRAVMGGLMAVKGHEDIWQTLQPHIPSLLDEWRSVLDDPQRFSSCRPYLGNEMLDLLLNDQSAEVKTFTDTTSWLLSTALCFHISLPEFQKRGIVGGDLPARTKEAVVESLTRLIGAQLDDGGWSFGGRSSDEHGHLYFTWGALQGYADFGDYVLGESADQIGVGADSDFIDYVGAELIAKFNESRTRSSVFLKSQYMTPALGNGIDFKVLTTKGSASLLSVEALGSEIPLLYAYAYMQESLILNGVDKEGIPSIGYSASQAREEMQKLQQIISDRFESVKVELRGTPDRARAVEISTFFLKATGKKKNRPITPEFTFKDPSLWPQLVRTFVLYPYYVERTNVPDRFAFDAYRLLTEDRRGAAEEPGAGLWDHDSFNLSVTSRAVEALIDIYDYVELFPHEAAPPAGDLASMLAAALAPHLQPLLPNTSTASQEQTSSVLKRDLQPWLDDNIRSPFKVIPIEIDRKLTFAGATFKDIAEAVYGQREAQRFEEDDDIAYAVFRSIAGVTYYTVIKCLPELLANALLCVATDEQRRQLVTKFQDDRSSLKDEMLHLMQTTIDRMLQDRDDRTFDIPQSPLPGPPQNRSKPKPR
jgi:hypothetical protein